MTSLELLIPLRLDVTSEAGEERSLRQQNKKIQAQVAGCVSGAVSSQGASGAGSTCCIALQVQRQMLGCSSVDLVWFHSEMKEQQHLKSCCFGDACRKLKIHFNKE